MVYETDFYTTRRSYNTRPVVSSYSVSYPVSRTVSGSSRVYSSSYPIYSYSPRITQRRVISSPVRTIYSTPIVRTRIISSPIRTTRVYSSPVRTTTTTRVISSPVRSMTTSVYSSPLLNEGRLPYSYSSLYSYPLRTTRVIESPVHVYTSSPYYRSSLTPERYITSPIRTLPSVLNKAYERIAQRVRPGYGYNQLNNYLNSESYINFEEETKRIRNSTQNLMRELHTPVVRRSRSVTPFPAYSYEPTSKTTLDSYINRMTNPTRHLAKEVHNLTQYPDTPRKYVGQSHLASMKILGDKSYNTRNPLYDSDKVRTDINLLSRYIQNKNLGKRNANKVVVSNGVPELDPFRPSRKFSAPAPLENVIDTETKEKQRLRKERLMTVNEEASIDDVAVEKKKAQRNDEIKRLDTKAVEDDKKKKAEAERKAKWEADHLAEEAKKADEEARRAREARLAEQARLAEEAKKAEQARLVEEEKLAEEAKLAEEEAAAAKLAEEARLAEEAKLAEAARLAEEAKLAEQARLAEEAKLAEEARKAEEQRLSEEQKTREEEMNRLAELEKIAGEEREAELARQAAELSEIARQEAEIAAQELQELQNSNVDAAEPVVEEPQSPLEEAPEQEITAEPSVSIDEVKSDVEE